MAEGDEYLDYLNETLEWATKPWSASLGTFLEMQWQVLNSLKRPHRAGRGKTGNRSRIHLVLVLSGVCSNEERDEAF